MKMSQVTKKQHYVPQFYLKRFTQDGKRIHVFDKVANKSFLAGIKDVAYENYFYDVPKADTVDGEKYQPEERALSVLEGKFNSITDVALKFAKDGQPVPTVKQLQDMALFTAIQLVRTPQYRDNLVACMELMGASCMKTVLQMAAPEIASQVRVELKNKEDYAPALHAQFMWNSEFVSKVAATLCTHIWVVGVNRTNTPLFTSDSPVVMRSSVPLSEYVPNTDNSPAFERAIDVVIESARPGVASEGVELYFPLNPQCVLIFLERKFFKSLEHRDGQRLILSDHHVKTFNILQVLQSYRQVYSSSNDFSLAEDVCAKYPEECDSSAERFIVRTMELAPK